MLLARLPGTLENAEALIKRREKAKTTKELWRSIYRDCQIFAMPSRETFTWHTEGQNKNQILYDSTLQEATDTAANTLTALLFPSWSRWADLAPGGAIKPEDITADIQTGLQNATKMFFDFLNSSNFNTVISEAARDLQIGTAALSFDEGDNDQPFVFTSIAISAIEIEEGPNGSVETTWMHREPIARNLLRMYPGLEMIDLPSALATKITEHPDEKIKIVQGEVYDPETKNYYGVVLYPEGPSILWRYNYFESSPTIVARATKVAGETYGRGRVMLALSDARTLDKMQEFVLRQAALQVAPPMTGVSDGVLNPYTASMTPNTIIPVASNDNGNPSLKPLQLGGNFNITEQMMKDLRERVRRTMLGPEPSEGPVKSATEISVSDRNRLWAMNGEYNRIQAELLAKILQRGVFILQKKGLMPKFKVDGRQVTIKYTSPFAKTQNAADVASLQNTLQFVIENMGGPQGIMTSFDAKAIPGYVARLNGVPENLILTDDQRNTLMQQAIQAHSQAQASGLVAGGQQQLQPGQAPGAPPPAGPSPTAPAQ